MKVIKALTALACVLCVSASGSNELVNLVENGMLSEDRGDEFVGAIVKNAEATSTTKTTSLWFPYSMTLSPTDYHSVFKKCLVETLPEITIGEMTFIFPPARAYRDIFESKADNGVDVTEMHKRIKGAFCSKVEGWASCVQHRLRTDTGIKRNRRLSAFLNVDGFGTQMKSYCDNSQQVTSMYACTLTKTRNSTCNGDFWDVLEYIVEGFDDVSFRSEGFDPNQFDKYCGEIRRRIMCRVMELAGCSIDYSSNMDRFLNGLLRDDCKKVDKFTENVDNDDQGNSTSNSPGQGGRNGGGSNKVALTLTFMPLAVGFVAVMRQCTWTL